MNRSLAWEAGIAALFVAIGVAAYFDHRPTYRDLETTVLSEPYADGGALVYRWDGTVTRNCRGAFRREIRQGDNTFHLPDRPFTWIPPSKWNGAFDNDFIVTVPMRDVEGHMEAGVASYHVTQVGPCNQIQYFFGGPVEEEYPPVIFNVTKREAE
jgi:hypothetical protein